MNIKQMHNVFRTIAQQMGMQLNRGILPESIDIFLNDAIITKVREELAVGIHTALQENTALQASTMSTVNLFRNLYKSYSLDSSDIDAQDVNNFNGYYIVDLSDIADDVMMYLGFSIKYDSSKSGRSTSTRLIGADVLETTLRDYCNGASKDSPIACLVSDAESSNQLEIYTNTDKQDVKSVIVKYIKKPAVVEYPLTDESKGTDCDLPDYVHYEIVERAVLKFYQSIGATTPQSKNNRQQQ